MCFLEGRNGSFRFDGSSIVLFSCSPSDIIMHSSFEGKDMIARLDQSRFGSEWNLEIANTGPRCHSLFN